jgi:hypothetical protein
MLNLTLTTSQEGAVFPAMQKLRGTWRTGALFEDREMKPFAYNLVMIESSARHTVFNIAELLRLFPESGLSVRDLLDYRASLTSIPQGAHGIAKARPRSACTPQGPVSMLLYSRRFAEQIFAASR